MPCWIQKIRVGLADVTQDLQGHLKQQLNDKRDALGHNKV